MTDDECAALGHAPELAVLHVLRAAAAASGAALAAAHPQIAVHPLPLEHRLAAEIYAAIVLLQDAIGAYCRYVVETRLDDEVAF
jgi:hypothetical protein